MHGAFGVIGASLWIIKLTPSNPSTPFAISEGSLLKLASLHVSQLVDRTVVDANYRVGLTLMITKYFCSTSSSFRPSGHIMPH